MDVITLVTKFDEPIINNTITEKIFHEVMGNMSDDMRACFFKGVPIDTIFENNTLTLKTRFPVSILKSPDGKILDIIIKKTI